MSNLSLENFENGIKLYQDNGLYKFTSDAINLAKLCKFKTGDHVLDMCAGSGVVGLYSYSVKPCKKLYFNDIQPQMCELIKRNIQINNLNDRASAICKNLKDLSLNDFEKPLDIIVCNPPYFKAEGKVKQDVSIAMCRHEISTNLGEIICKASEIIKVGGQFYLIIPADRLCECVILLNKGKFEVKDIEMHHTEGRVKTCVLKSVKCAKSGVKINIKGE